MTAVTRNYRGASSEARRAERRARLIEAAISVYGKVGYGRAGVRAICREASLTERYFYESFAGSEDLLSAAFAAVSEGLAEILQAALDAADPEPEHQLRAVLTAYYDRLREDSAGARVFLLEIMGVSPAIDREFRAALRRLGKAFEQILPALADMPPLLADGLAGGIAQIALAWIDEGYRTPIEQVVAAAGQLFDGIGRPAVKGK